MPFVCAKGRLRDYLGVLDPLGSWWSFGRANARASVHALDSERTITAGVGVSAGCTSGGFLPPGLGSFVDFRQVVVLGRA